MKRRWESKSITTILICIILFFSNTWSFSATSNDGYEEGYYEGWLLGVEEAEYDMSKGKSKNYYRSIPSDEEIIKEYDLKSEVTRYRNDFLEGFNAGFKDGYNWAYALSDDEDYGNDEDNEESNVSDYALTIGFTLGQAYGYRDYYDDKTNNWSRAVPSSSEIANIFDLRNETSDYRKLFLEDFKESFQEGYEEGYRKAKYEPFEYSYTQGTEDGTLFGGLLGEMHGKKDFYLNRDNDWERNFPSNSRIISTFALNKDSIEYEEAFIESFTKSYRENYNNGYRSANSELSGQNYESGYNQGKEIGFKRGTELASIDLLMGQSNSILRHAYSNEYGVINEYKLYLESEQYREGFISGYFTGLNEGYNTTYQELNFDNYISKTETQIIPISGGEISTEDNRIKLKIDSGTYYNDIAVTINGLDDAGVYNLPNANRYIKASEIYSVQITNKTNTYDNTKPIEISFEYYGSQKGGIYKFENNKWIYFPSKISEGRITTYVKPSTLSINKGVFAVFVDDGFNTIKDIRGHWAKDEINTFAKRGLAGLFNDNSYRPDLPITRGQLLGLLSRVYKWDLTGLDDIEEKLKNLEDYDSLKDYSSLIAYGLKNSYVGIYNDNTFKVYNKVTYNQINNIMKKITGDSSFDWNDIAYKMMMEKDTRCKSYDSMDNNLTRAEAIYMLFLLNE